MNPPKLLFAAEIVDLSLQNNCIKNELSIKKTNTRKERKEKTNHEWLWKLCAKDTDKIYFFLLFSSISTFGSL